MTFIIRSIISENDLPVMESLSLSRNRPIKVACVGDSLTESPYPAILAKLLGDDYIVGNFGASGATLLSHGDNPYTSRDEYGLSREFSPDVVIIMLGTNDTKPWNWECSREFKENYRRLVESYLSLPSQPRVYLCTPPWVALDGNYGITDEPIVEQQIPWIREIAAEMDLTLIDTHTNTQELVELYMDNVHFNDDGCGYIAGLVNYALTRAPVISPISKLFYDYEVVSMTAMPGDEVRYTLDGTDPDMTSLLYSEPIKIVRDAGHNDNDVITVSACCYRNGKRTSINRTLLTVTTPLKNVEIDNAKPGLQYRYYEGEIRTLDNLVLDNPLKSGVVEDITLEPAQVPEYYAFAFDGFIYVPNTEIFTFYLYSDDGSRLWIDGKPIIDNDGLHFRLGKNGCVCLAAGYHKIHLQYFQDGGDASVDIFYLSRSIQLCKFPAGQLFH